MRMQIDTYLQSALGAHDGPERIIHVVWKVGSKRAGLLAMGVRLDVAFHADGLQLNYAEEERKDGGDTFCFSLAIDCMM